jgi:NADH:ubiquinone oxidoreductase subunit F (NADH-binding)
MTADSVLSPPRVLTWPTVKSRLLGPAPHDVETLSGYLDRGGYRDVGDLPSRLEVAGLLGRGGAGFPVARKLAAVSAAAGQKVVVANGEEGEPGSVKDRYLMTHRPHLVLDGLRLMAAACGADRAFVYVSDPDSEASVRRALDEGAALWPSAVGVFGVEHSYVAGEETALVRALDGGPALPTAKPPRPFEAGVGGAPTLVQNVETLAHVANLARDTSAGDTFLATLSQSGREPALVEMPFGVRLGDLLSWSGAEHAELRGVLAGGLFGGLLADPWALPLTHAALREVGSGLGCGAFALLGDDDCPVDTAADVVAFLAVESSRQCGACINATAGIRDVLAALRAGACGSDQVQRMAGWTVKVPGRGACALVDAAARTASSLLREFPAEVDAHLAGPCPRCAALGPLPRLTRHCVAPVKPVDPVTPSRSH